MWEMDVAIVGGGPAGVATALALQKQGNLRVAILEKSYQDGFRIGETVPPAIRASLAQLDVLDRVEGDGHLPALGSCSAWGGEVLGFNDFWLYAGGGGWHLDRRRFDAMLMNAAVERGAVLKRGIRVVGWEKHPEGKWELMLLEQGGRRSQLATRFVVDATGYRGAFALQQGAQIVRSDALIAIATLFELEKAFPQDGYTLIEAAQLGWWYAAHLPGHRAIVTLMSDRELLQQQQFSRPAVWRAQLEKTRYVREVCDRATAQSQLWVKPAFSQYLAPITGNGWLAVGDAACTLDPLSSAGINKALHSAIKAAAAIVRHFNGDSNALHHYATQIQHQVELYLADRRKYYQQETRWPRSPFWQHRSSPITLSPSSLLYFEDSAKTARALQTSKMHLPAKELRLLCALCTSPIPASQVVSQFLNQTHHKISSYRTIEALQYLIKQHAIQSLA